MLWISEGFVLDDAGNLISTSYVDLREPEERTKIHGLVKGCRRRYALEDSDTILISPPSRFRMAGKNLIRDPQEGRAREETETPIPETPEQANRRREVEDQNEAMELLLEGMNSVSRVTRRLTHRSVRQTSKSLVFGKEWWIFSTSIAPDTEHDKVAWRKSLDPDYDHTSTIGQPAKFAQALGRMVTEQLGPQGRAAPLKTSLRGRYTTQSTYPSQMVLHGPVVYAERLHEALTRNADEATTVARYIFAKDVTHSAQREYRFAILCDRHVKNEQLLTVSGMMRDSLRPTTSGFVRRAPRSVEERPTEEERSGARPSGKRTILHQSSTERERVTKRYTKRVRRRGSAGQLLWSASRETETVQEREVTRDSGTDPCGVRKPALPEAADDGGVRACGEQSICPDGTETESKATDEEAVKEIARQAVEPGSGGRGRTLAIPILDDATGRISSQRAERVRKAVDDACFAIPIISEPWAEKNLTEAEIRALYRIVATLADRVARVGREQRHVASSAALLAMQCVRNIYVEFGDIVDRVAMERERFVVFHLQRPELERSSGCVVVSPDGLCAYGLRGRGREWTSQGTCEQGIVWMPTDEQARMFEFLGWPRKGGK